MSSRSAIVLLLLPLLAVAACDRKSPAPEQANTVAAAATPDEVPSAPAAPAAPAVVAPDYSHRGEAAPDLAFADGAGRTTTLAAFRGKPLLVNLWATWCAPCVAEMPTLDAAAGSLAGKTRVLTVSQDLEPAKAATFFATRKLKHLQLYTDPKLGLSLAYKANLPTTILYDSGGREVWRVTGGRDWTGADARTLIAQAS